MKKFVSFIVPVYNVEAYLSRCIESILKQTIIENYEIILIDDGSKDKSGAICDKYAQGNQCIRVIHKGNGGLSSARNAGLEIANGEFVFFADSDDVIHPQTIEIMSSKLDENIDIIVGRFDRFSNDMQIVFEGIENKRYAELHGQQCLLKMYDFNNEAPQYVSACGKLFRKRLFEKIRFPEGKLFEDEFTTYLLYYQAKKIISYDHIFYYYFDNFGGITRNLTIEKYFDRFQAQWNRILFYRDNKMEEVYKKSIRYFLESAKWNLIACRNKKGTFDEKRGKEFETQYKKVFSMARTEQILDFLKDYDYYVLANPNWTIFYRVNRILLIIINKQKKR